MRYESEGGWSIWYPPDWEVLADADNDLLLKSSSDNPALFVVGSALDATEPDAGSLDYLTGNANFAVEDGLLHPFDPEDWFDLDLDFDGETGLLDIYGFELEFAMDPATGDAFPEGAVAPVWWYGYYNPDVRPATGFIFQIFGQDTLAYQIVDAIVSSFEPPGGIPGLDT